jgi:hypothetical protein
MERACIAMERASTARELADTHTHCARTKAPLQHSFPDNHWIVTGHSLLRTVSCGVGCGWREERDEIINYHISDRVVSAS